MNDGLHGCQARLALMPVLACCRSTPAVSVCGWGNLMMKNNSGRVNTKQTPVPLFGNMSWCTSWVYCGRTCNIVFTIASCIGCIAWATQEKNTYEMQYTVWKRLQRRKMLRTFQFVWCIQLPPFFILAAIFIFSSHVALSPSDRKRNIFIELNWGCCVVSRPFTSMLHPHWAKMPLSSIPSNQTTLELQLSELPLLFFFFCACSVINFFVLF